MEGFIIFAPSGTKLSRFIGPLEKSEDKDLSFHLVDDPSEQVVIEKDDGRVYVHEMVDTYPLEIDYTAKEVERFRRIVPDPVLFGVDYNKLSLGKEVVSIIANEPDLLVDNDFGTILRGTDFVRRILDEPDWDWRPSSEELGVLLKNAPKDNEDS